MVRWPADEAEARDELRGEGLTLRLVKASLEAPAGLQEFLSAARADEWLNDSDLPFLNDSDLPFLDQGLSRFLQHLVDVAAGRNLPAAWVPATTFWLLDDSERAVAMSNLRHELTPFLLNHGGHIGYYVAREQRGKGYGTHVLALTLEEARKLGLQRVLLTVDSDNERSIRVIERNEAVMEDEGIDETTGRLHRRYWIELR